ncbi:MAG TPA: amidohydrolase [Terriglobales bacterium]|nr:amidohydrolase [Terriglobales bacterium]
MYEKILAAIEAGKSPVLETADFLWKHPETGYREYEGSRFVANKLRELGLTVKEFDIPGCVAVFDTGKPGPNICIMGELDSLIVFDHPDCNEKGYVHACAHHMQTAAMLGAAYGLLKSEAKDELCGKLTFVAVPAEEFIELAYREELRKAGKIRYYGGKPEFIARGVFDDVDISLLCHGATRKEDEDVWLYSTSNGLVGKIIHYTGLACHAASPHKGVNALYAATQGLSAVNAIREKFEEKDHIRVHPIMTRGGDVVNAIPDHAELETYVRASNVEAMKAAAKAVDRAFVGGAVSMGCECRISSKAGYMPTMVSRELTELCQEVVPAVTGKKTSISPHGNGSTDMGDVSTLMPAMQFNVGGSVGDYHGKSICIPEDSREAMYLNGGRVMAAVAFELLRDGGKKANKVTSAYKPEFASPAEYLATADSFYADKTYKIDIE